MNIFHTIGIYIYSHKLSIQGVLNTNVTRVVIKLQHNVVFRDITVLFMKKQNNKIVIIVIIRLQHKVTSGHINVVSMKESNTNVISVIIMLHNTVALRDINKVFTK